MAAHDYKRRIFIVNRKFQFKYLAIILFTMMVSIFAVGFTTFYVIWNKVIDEFFFVPEASKKLGDIFVQTSEMLIIPIVLLSVLFAVAGILLSHKVAGPLYRVQRVAEEVQKGNLNVQVRFRKGDDLQELARTLNEMIGGVRQIVGEDKQITDQLAALAARLKDDVSREKGLKKDVKETINELNEIVAKLKRTTDRFIV